VCLFNNVVDFVWKKYSICIMTITTTTTTNTTSNDGDSNKFFMNGKRIEIRDVWADTLESEMEIIRSLSEKYKYVAMDTEFPGVVARPMGSFSSNTDYHYQTLRVNVDLLKIIQLGITFVNEHGEFPDGCPTFQFNFKFSLEEDIYAQDSIDLLKRSGIDFHEHQEKGINIHTFAELFISSGLILCDDIKWISFHSGYDFGYLLKLLTDTFLPSEEIQFFQLLRTYFPYIYDVKHMMLISDDLKGGLQKLSEDLQIERIGPMHQAGSDSLLTAATFFKLRQIYFNNYIDDNKYNGVLYGLGSNHTYNVLSREPVTPSSTPMG